MSEEPEAKTEPSLVFERALTRHTLTEDILGLLTGTFTVSFGLYLLHTVGAVTGEPPGSHSSSATSRRGRSLLSSRS